MNRADFADSLGRPISTERSIIGRTWRRREPQGDPADIVISVGTIDYGNADIGPVPELIVTCREFGAIPDGWDSATESYPFEDFAREYTEASDQAVAVLAVEDALKAKEADERVAAEDRLSPWSYVATNQRRTGIGSARKHDEDEVTK